MNLFSGTGYYLLHHVPLPHIRSRRKQKQCLPGHFKNQKCNNVFLCTNLCRWQENEPVSFQITRPLNDSFRNNLNHCSLGSAITWVLMTSKIHLSPAAKEQCALCLHYPQRQLRMCPLDPQPTPDILDNYTQATKKWPSNICEYVRQQVLQSCWCFMHIAVGLGFLSYILCS